MLIKMLTVVFAGVFIGAAVIEMKIDRHGKKKEQREREAADSNEAESVDSVSKTEATGELDDAENDDGNT